MFRANTTSADKSWVRTSGRTNRASVKRRITACRTYDFLKVSQFGKTWFKYVRKVWISDGVGTSVSDLAKKAPCSILTSLARSGPPAVLTCLYRASEEVFFLCGCSWRCGKLRFFSQTLFCEKLRQFVHQCVVYRKKIVAVRLNLK